MATSGFKTQSIGLKMFHSGGIASSQPINNHIKICAGVLLSQSKFVFSHYCLDFASATKSFLINYQFNLNPKFILLLVFWTILCKDITKF
jgi:hypothetical protein